MSVAQGNMTEQEAEKVAEQLQGQPALSNVHVVIRNGYYVAGEFEYNGLVGNFRIEEVKYESSLGDL